MKQFHSCLCCAFLLLIISHPGLSSQLMAKELSNFLPSAGFTLVSEYSTKRVLVPHEDIGNSWFQDINFDDSAWLLCEGAPGGVGYEKSSGYESFISLDVGDDMHQDGGNPNPGCYIRIPFTVQTENIQQFRNLYLNIRADDGYVAYLNGQRVSASGAPNPLLWNSASTANYEADTPVRVDISSYLSGLVDGQNLLAIHGLNANTTSSDFIITVEMIASDDLYGGFTESNMPIIILDTNGQGIPNEPKLNAQMKVIDYGPAAINHPNDVPTDYAGPIGIEIRGHHSSGFPQKPYALETRDENGENFNISLLGMPPENDWILLSNYNEKSLIRTTLALDLFRSMGHYAPRAKLVEVVLNASYQGIYVFTEKIKRDNNRVDIAKLRPTENSADSLTGGYIIKIDYHSSSDSWLSDFHPMGHPEQNVYFVYNYPKADEITDQQKNYIQDFICTAETILYSDNFSDRTTGYHHYFDVESFIDYFILSEVSRNVDGYKKSRYFYKDRDSKDGRLHAGPVWDFDWAWKNILEGVFAATDGSGWSYTINDYGPDVNPPGWYYRLLQDYYFTNKLIDRYQELRQSLLSLVRINAYIDSVQTYVSEAQVRHFDLWPIEQDYRAPEADPPSPTYEAEVDKLKNWIQLRIAWLDQNIPTLRRKIINENEVSLISSEMEMPGSFRVFPNPVSDVLHVEIDSPVDKIEIFNVLGQRVYLSNNPAVRSQHIQVSEFQSGIYFIKLIKNNKQVAIFKHTFTK